MSHPMFFPVVPVSSRLRATVLVLCPALVSAFLLAAVSPAMAAPVAPAQPQAGAKGAAAGVPDKGPKADAKKVAEPGEVVFIPSTFVDNPRDATFGRDIFFPDSQRLVVKDNIKSDEPNSSDGMKKQLLKELVLRGISGKSNRRLALINSRTLAPGEIWDFKASGGHTRRIKCEEIRPKSVVISIEGVADKQELQLREGL